MAVQLPQHLQHVATIKKPRVSIICLGDFERTGWCNWPLVGTLLSAAKDQRYTVMMDTILGMRGFDSARNLAVDFARKHNSDFLVTFDNDVFSPVPPLDIVTDMIRGGIDIVTMSYGVNVKEQGLRWCSDQTGDVRGQYREVSAAGMGCAVISRKVWETVPGPWYVWQPQRDELLSPGLGEDTAFCTLVRKHGFRIWTHSCPAQHFKTCDQSQVISLLQNAALAASSGK